MSDSVDIILRLQGERVVAQKLKYTSREFKKFGREVERSGKGTKGLNKELRVMSGVMKLVKVASVVASLGLLTQVVSALTAGVISFVAAFAPALGLIGAAPGLGLALAQGFNVAKIATTGLMDAVGGLNEGMDLEKLAALTPQAQYLAVELDSLKGYVRDLQIVAQDGILPGLMEAAKGARPALQMLSPIVAMTASAIGRVIDASIDLAKLWKGDVLAVGTSGAGVVEAMGKTAVALAGALWTVLYVARPLVAWITRGTQAWAEHLQASATAARESGSMAEFFDRAKHSMQLIMGLIKPLAQGLGNIFSAALPTGEKLVTMMTHAAEGFAAWSESAKGQNAIKAWFEQGMPAMIEAGRIVRMLLHGFLELGNGKEVAPLLKLLRTDLLPVLGTLIQKTTKEFAPVFIKALTEVVKLLVVAFDAAPVKEITSALGGLAAAATWVLTEVPGAKAALTAILLLLAGNQVLTIASGGFRRLGGSIALMGERAGMVRDGVKSMYGGMQNLVTVMRDGRTANSAFTGKVGATITAIKNGTTATLTFVKSLLATAVQMAKTAVQQAILGVRMVAQSVATGIATVAQWAWNAALTAGAVAMAILTSPITLIVVGIVATIAVIVLVIKHWGWFRDKLMAVYGWLKAHWPLILGILTGPVGLAVLFIVKKWDVIVESVKGLGARISSAAHGMFDGIKSAFKGVINWIIRAWNGLHFQMPEIDTHIPKVGKIGGIDMRVPQIPELAAGGVVSRGLGSWITGEAGPELNSFDGNRIRVQPLTSSAPVESSKGLAGALGDVVSRVSGSDRKQYMLVLPDGRVLAELVDEHAGDDEARR